jgi:hypothetical protein
MLVKLVSLCLFVGLGVSDAVLLAQRASERPKPAQGVEASVYIVTPSQITWTDPPAEVARGTPSIAPGSPLRYAPIQGDPLKPGVPFAIRLQCPDGYKVAPHWHARDENIVVLEGAFSLGTGDRFDTGRMQDIPAGGYGLVRGQVHHFALCKGKTDMLVYGIGPRLNNWISVSSATSTHGTEAKVAAK